MAYCACVHPTCIVFSVRQVPEELIKGVRPEEHFLGFFLEPSIRKELGISIDYKVAYRRVCATILVLKQLLHIDMAMRLIHTASAVLHLCCHSGCHLPALAWIRR